MAFNGSAHFKPGELVSYFESIGARLGPHVNAYTSFDETVYMLDLPTDKPEIVEKGLTALADFAGGLTLDPEEIDKERGVVIEEWRGGLGAGSRIRDKQIPGALLQLALRRAPADRQAGDHPQRAGRRGCARSTTPGTGPSAWRWSPSATSIAQQIEQTIKTPFGRLKARGAGRAGARSDGAAPPGSCSVSVVTDPEVTQSSVQIVRKRPREGEPTGRRLPPRPRRSGSSST